MKVQTILPIGAETYSPFVDVDQAWIDQKSKHSLPLNASTAQRRLDGTVYSFYTW